MNLREKNLGSKACWHDNREYSKQSTMKQCVYLEKKNIELLEFLKNHKIMI